jgi:type I restriction enzyme S subunit
LLREEIFSQSWPTKPLGEVVEFLDNLRKPVKSSDRTEGDFNYYGANGLQGTIDDFLFDEPLVLLAEDGGHFGNPERNIAYIAEGKYWVNNHAHVLKPREGLDLRFLYRVLQKYDVSKYIKGATRAKLTKGDAAVMPIPLPPLTEQKRIAAILDKADAIRRKRQQAIQLADDFLRAVFLDMFGDPVTNPKGWEIKPISCGIASITSGWSAKGESYPCKSNEYGVLKISSVTSGKFKPEENKFIHNEEIPVGKKLEFPKKGDLLFSRANTRELVAATCIAPSDYNNIFLPDKLWNVRTNKELLPEFVNYLMRQPRFKERLTSQATGTSGSMLNISKAKFEATESIFPPLELQKKFKAIYWKVQELISRLDDSLNECGNTFTSLSQKAFRGEL